MTETGANGVEEWLLLVWVLREFLLVQQVESSEPARQYCITTEDCVTRISICQQVMYQEL